MATGLAPKGEKPDKVFQLTRNRRPYTGQKLGVKLSDGRVEEIPEQHVNLAIVRAAGPGSTDRILDRGPWSGVEIVELDR